MQPIDYGIISCLLGAVVYFLKRWINKVESDIQAAQKDIRDNKKELSDYADSSIAQALEKFTVVVKALNQTVADMNQNITSLEKVTGIFEAQSKMRDEFFTAQFGTIEKGMSDQTQKIANHEKRITIIETSIEIKEERKGQKR